MNPSSILKEAFDLHYEKRFSEALAKYRLLVATHPESEEAIVARMQIDNLSSGASRGSEGNLTGDKTAAGTPEVSSAVFDCVNCTGRIRLKIPAAADAFRCPKCQHAYSVVIASSDPLVAVVVPAAIRELVQAPQRAMPAHVLAAFGALELEPTYEISTVRERYLALIAQYHPDKVSHLGPELKRLAQEKTTRIVGAYATVGEYLKR